MQGAGQTPQRRGFFRALGDDAAGGEIGRDVKRGAQDCCQRQGRDELYGGVFERRKHGSVLILIVCLFVFLAPVSGDPPTCASG